ncbi:hypothetical protein [Nocardia camponoti]|uniref:Uncharacterized protein n=1 Tax=Nocardia camponoti TaxID=1616106 RepID=A0A917QGJ7_9NOCA|nr:hypothetical protein [Nocardia camponoti]GGK48045.1 hypothetical protein GCM10011591_19270 [Nocardia camponoti]
MIESDLEAQTQLVVLARTLQVHPRAIAPLSRLGADHLSALQRHLLSALHAEHADTFRRLAPLVPIFPLGLGVSLFERVVPPVLAARLLGTIGNRYPQKLAQALCAIDTIYACDGAPYLDPDTFAGVMRYGTAKPIADIINELLRRRDYLTAARFLSSISDPIVDELERSVLDDAGLMFTGAYAYPAHRLSYIIRVLIDGPNNRIPGFIHATLVGSGELQHANLAILCKVEPDVTVRLGEYLFGRGSVQAVGRYVLNVVHRNAGATLLTVAGRLNPAGLWGLSGNPQMQNPDVLARLVHSLRGRNEPEPWRGLFALASRTTAPARHHLAEALVALDEATIAALPAHATDADAWSPLFQLLSNANARGQSRVAAIWSRLSPEWQASIERHVREHRYDTRLSRITSALTPISPDEVFFRRRQRVRQRGDDGLPAW